MPPLMITNAGRQAAIDADNNGLQVSLETLVFGSGRYTPDGTETALQNQIASTTFNSSRLIGEQLALFAAVTTGMWAAYEVGVLLDDGTLFAVASSGPGGAALATKSGADLILTVNLLLTGTPAGSVTVTPNIQLSVDTATTARLGIVELATNQETINGSDAERAVTPAALAAKTATTGRRGLVELATTAETQGNSDGERAVTPQALAARTATTARRGLVELATVAEAKAGTDTQRAVTPEGLNAVFTQFEIFGTVIGGSVAISSNDFSQNTVALTRALTDFRFVNLYIEPQAIDGPSNSLVMPIISIPPVSNANGVTFLQYSGGIWNVRRNGSMELQFRRTASVTVSILGVAAL